MVGNLVLGVAGGGEEFDAALEKFGILIGVLAEFPALQALEILSVFLVGQAVGGDMVGCEFDGLLQAVFPLRKGLPRHTVDQIKVEVVVTGSAENGERLSDLLCIMDASENFEQFRIPRLHAHADAIDAVRAEKIRFASGDGGGIHFDGELGDAREVEVALQSGKKTVELRDGECGGCSSADENGFRCTVAAEEFSFTDDRIDQRIGFPRAGNVLVETAIRADLQAEGDVQIQVLRTCDE